MYDAVVIGVSAGGMQALKTILPALPRNIPFSIAIVQHTAPTPDSYLAEYLGQISSIPVKEAEDKEPLQLGTAYLAPPGYHLLIEADKTFSLSVDDRVNFSCPSIDVLFESAADVFQDRLIGIILTGANADGSKGLKAIQNVNGLTIVQNPATAEVPFMPQAALSNVLADHILNLEKIAPLLVQLGNQERKSA
jgi:two-component system chemotaxis response regulator CheB